MKVFAVASMVMGVSALASEESKNRPVTKVINLLKDMQKTLQTELENDKEIYDKMACWCTTNDKEKTESIAAAENEIARLTSKIEELTGLSARLTTEIANHDKEVAAAQDALAKLTAQRQKELAEFNAEEKDLLQSIGALKSAVTVLSKHNSFLQTDSAAKKPLLAVAALLKANMVKYDLTSNISPAEKETLNNFLQAPAYANQSGEIFGILGNMKDTFEANLKQSQDDETAAQSQYEDLKAAKEEEIKAGQEQSDKKTVQLAAADEDNASAKEKKKNTEASLSADEQFLSNLKEKCAQTDEEFAARNKARNTEITAVGEALAFLNSDEAHDLFTKTFNFVQVSAMDARKASASKVLRDAAMKLHKPVLAQLASSVKLDAFTKVKKAIDDLVSELKTKQQDESKHRDYCIKSLNENEKQRTKQTRDNKDDQTKIDKLTADIEAHEKVIETLTTEIEETQKNLKIAGENREKENAEFQVTVKDQQSTIMLLTKAMDVLKAVYEKSALIQQAPPAGFKNYEQNAGGSGSSGVIGMITQIIEDSKAMKAEAEHDENDAQAAYESMVQTSNETITTKKAERVAETEAKANAEEDKSATEQSLDDGEAELALLESAKAALHGECDFFIKTFDQRQASFTSEIEALQQAKSILSGSMASASS